jgi:hypothetical protein
MPKVARAPRHRGTSALGRALPEGGGAGQQQRERGQQEQHQPLLRGGRLQRDVAAGCGPFGALGPDAPALSGTGASTSGPERGVNVAAIPAKEASNKGGTAAGAKGDAAASGAPSEAAAGDGLSRGQKKRQAKKLQYLRREQLVMSSLRLRREQDQRTRIDGLDALRAALLDAAAAKAPAESELEAEKAAPPPSQLRSAASRQRLVRREAAQMALVARHPAFREDPFGAIGQHLRNTAVAAATAAAEKGRSSPQQRTKSGKGSPSSPSGPPGDKPEPHRARRRRKHHRVRPTRAKSR